MVGYTDDIDVVEEQNRCAEFQRLGKQVMRRELKVYSDKIKCMLTSGNQTHRET